MQGGKTYIFRPTVWLQFLVAADNGVPLFVEEITKSVLETGLLKEVDGHYNPTTSPEPTPLTYYFAWRCGCQPDTLHLWYDPIVGDPQRIVRMFIRTIRSLFLGNSLEMPPGVSILGGFQALQPIVYDMIIA